MLAINISTALFTISISTDNCSSTTHYHPTGEVSQPVTFIELYNKVSDNRPVNFEACDAVEALGTGRLRVHARHTYGSVDLGFETRDAHVTFSVLDLAGWHADPVERHLRLGHFWQGMPSMRNETAPVVMGKIQGALGLRGLGGPPAPTAGFVTISRNTYYDSIFYAEPGARLAFVFTPSEQRDALWQSIGRDEGVLDDVPARFLSWYWTDSAFSETTRATEVARAKALGAQVIFITVVTEDSPWVAAKDRFPRGLNDTVAYVRSQGLQAARGWGAAVLFCGSEAVCTARVSPAVPRRAVQVGLHMLPMVVHLDDPIAAQIADALCLQREPNPHSPGRARAACWPGDDEFAPLAAGCPRASPPPSARACPSAAAGRSPRKTLASGALVGKTRPTHAVLFTHRLLSRVQVGARAQRRRRAQRQPAAVLGGAGGVLPGERLDEQLVRAYNRTRAVRELPPSRASRRKQVGAGPAAARHELVARRRVPQRRLDRLRRAQLVRGGAPRGGL
jgi:hypothetical protein